MGVFGTPTLNNVHAVRIDIHDVDFVAQPDQYLLSYVSLTAPRTLTLPDCIGDLDGRNKVYIIKDETYLADIHNIKVIGATVGGNEQPIDGILGGILINTKGGSMTIISNGVSWYIV